MFQFNENGINDEKFRLDDVDFLEIDRTPDIYTGYETDENGNEVWKVDYLVVEPGGSNPSAKVPDEFKKIDLTGKFDAKGFASIAITGLDSNSVYNVYAYDAKIAKERKLVYAQYNIDITARTKGDPFAPMTIEAAPQDTMHYFVDEVFEESIKLPIPATPIRAKLDEFVRFANRAASVTVSRPGAIPAMPTKQELEAL